jgi:SAM-dependent methyltransferase
MKCIVCKTTSKKVDHNIFFRHLDFETIDKYINFYKCNFCQLVFNPKYLEIEKISQIKSKLYLFSNQTNHKLFSKKEKFFATRAFFQVQLFKKTKILNKKINQILDFGCFDGLFLKEISKNFKNIISYGFDTNPFLKKIFLLNKDKFITSEKKLLKYKFDLVFFSFSIFYIYSLTDLFSKILKNILNDDGKIIVHIPNIYINPNYALYGDQRFIPTKESLINLFSMFGYSHSLLSSEIFSKDYILVFKKEVFIKKRLVDNKFFKLVRYLNLKKNKLAKLPRKNYSILGTTISAAFYDSALKEKNLFFVDENADRTKATFRGKKVFDPITLDGDSHVIIPNFKGARILANRLKKKYKTNFYLL